MIHKSSLMLQNLNKVLSLLFVIAILVSSCNPGPDYSVVPELSFIGMSKNTMNQGINADTIFVTLGFIDGDGDISISETNPNKLNLTVRDLRTGNISDKFLLPQIPVSGASNGITGELTVKMLSVCCVYPVLDSIPPCSVTTLYPTNALVWEYTLTDDAGNVSNSVITNPINLSCQ